MPPVGSRAPIPMVRACLPARPPACMRACVRLSVCVLRSARQLFFGVLDGHGGHECAELVYPLLPSAIAGMLTLQVACPLLEGSSGLPSGPKVRGKGQG